MLVIRLQRTGRKGHAMFRIVVQDSRRTPSSGKIVEQLGHYDPHTKTITLDKEKAKTFLSNGAQPSERVISILKSQKVDLPKWVKEPSKKESDVKNPDKRRSTAPEQPKEEAPAEAEVTETPAEEAEVSEASPEVEAPAEEVAAPSEENAEPEADEQPEETAEAPAEKEETPKEAEE